MTLLFATMLVSMIFCIIIFYMILRFSKWSMNKTPPLTFQHETMRAGMSVMRSDMKITSHI